MSASDDYHRHRLRTATKYFKVSVKPFQRLAECEAEPHEERLAECEAEPHEERLGRARGGGASQKLPEEKRKINGNPTRRPPARLIALYEVV